MGIPPASWSNASNYATINMTMLRKKLVTGSTEAGLLAVLVSTHEWNAPFFAGH